MFLKLLELISLLLYGDLGRFVGVVYAHCVVSYLGRVWLWLWLLQYAFRSQVAYSFLELLLSEICSTELSSRIVNENLRGCQICKRVHDVREVLYSVFSFFASMRSKLISSEVGFHKMKSFMCSFNCSFIFVIPIILTRSLPFVLFFSRFVL